MILISNYGNVNGPTSKQNTPPYVEYAIKMGYHCKIDVYRKESQLYMGTHPISLDFILTYHKKLWICCNDIESLKYLLEFECFHVFYKDHVTNEGFLWNSPILSKKSIYVINEPTMNKLNGIEDGYGICSDYISKIDLMDNRR
jgi:hypothetical protein